MRNKKKKAYILNQKIDHEFNAAGKAMRDVFWVFTRNGVKIMPGVPKNASKWLKVFDIPVLVFYMIFVLGKEDYCIFSYPENHLKIRLLKKLAPIRGVKVVCFINDMNSIREGNFDSPEVKERIKIDMELVGSASIIMAPNKNSKEFLQSQGITSDIITVGTWDYIMEDGAAENHELSMENAIHKEGEKWILAFAGNLNKASFIEKLNEVAGDNILFRLWGNCDRKIEDQSCSEYMGSVSPEVLPYHVAGCHMGLVWDGISVHACEGGLGEYLQFNNSHKCGLYLASGLPVFVWRKAGLADFVEENGCGFAIDSLDEIAGILENLSGEDYEKLLENVKRVSGNVRKGYYLERALMEMYKL